MKTLSVTSQLRRLRPMLGSRDPNTIAQALALIEALDSPKLVEAILASVRADTVHERLIIETVRLSSTAYPGLQHDHILTLLHGHQGPMADKLRRMLTAQRIDGSHLFLLDGLTALTTLGITGTLPEDVAARLAALPALEQLTLQCEPVASLRFLPPHLQKLRIATSLCPTLDLADDLDLDTLILCVDTPTLSGSLGGCRRLSLDLTTSVTDIDVLTGAERLEELLLAGSAQSEPLAPGGLEAVLCRASLRRVVLGGRLSGEVVDLLPHLHHLTELDSDQHRGLSSIAGLSPRAPLTRLDLRGTRLCDLTGIGSRPSLRVVRLESCRVLADVSALSGAPQLRLITLHRTAITPEQVPQPVRWAATWMNNPRHDILSARPMPPDADAG